MGWVPALGAERHVGTGHLVCATVSPGTSPLCGPYPLGAPREAHQGGEQLDHPGRQWSVLDPAQSRPEPTCAQPALPSAWRTALGRDRSSGVGWGWMGHSRGPLPDPSAHAVTDALGRHQLPDLRP